MEALGFGIVLGSEIDKTHAPRNLIEVIARFPEMFQHILEAFEKLHLLYEKLIKKQGMGSAFPTLCPKWGRSLNETKRTSLDNALIGLFRPTCHGVQCLIFDWKIPDKNQH
jgi:hypothetical protein